MVTHSWARASIRVETWAEVEVETRDWAETQVQARAQTETQVWVQDQASAPSQTEKDSRLYDLLILQTLTLVMSSQT